MAKKFRYAIVAIGEVTLADGRYAEATIKSNINFGMPLIIGPNKIHEIGIKIWEMQPEQMPRSDDGFERVIRTLEEFRRGS
jgi:hypothetical protein